MIKLVKFKICCYKDDDFFILFISSYTLNCTVYNVCSSCFFNKGLNLMECHFTRDIDGNDTGGNHLRVILQSLLWCRKRQSFAPVGLFVQGCRDIGNRTFRPVAQRRYFSICFRVGTSLKWDDVKTVRHT